MSNKLARMENNKDRHGPYWSIYFGEMMLAYSDSELNAGLIVTALNTAAEQGVITLVELGQDDEH